MPKAPEDWLVNERGGAVNAMLLVTLITRMITVWVIANVKVAGS